VKRKERHFSGAPLADEMV